VPAVFLIAVVVVLAGVFFAATGRGGELAYERVDHAPLDLGPVSAPDIAMLRPPTAAWGYNMQVTDEALDRIARAMRDRDVTIAYLQQQQLANRLSADPGVPHGRHTAEPPAASEALQTAEPPAASEAPHTAEPAAASEAPRAAVNPDSPHSRIAAKAPGVLVAPLPPKATQPSATTPSPEASLPAQATQPSQTLPGSFDAQGPQGAYDTHGWWAQQEEAAREEEARRQAAAQEADQTLPNQADLPEAIPSEAIPSEASPSEASSSSGRTGTLPNPVITSPGGTATSSDHGDQPTASSVPPVPPDNDTIAAAEEQGW
jgi:hypothetical protein